MSVTLQSYQNVVILCIQTVPKLAIRQLQSDKKQLQVSDIYA